MLNQKVSTNLKRLRLLNDYTQDYVETSLDISHRTYSKIENGEGRIDLDRLETFAKFYKTDAITIITMSDDGSFVREAPGSKSIAEPIPSYGKADVALAKCEEKCNGLKKEIVLLKQQNNLKEKTIADKEMIIKLLTGEA